MYYFYASTEHRINDKRIQQQKTIEQSERPHLHFPLRCDFLMR